MKRILDDRSQLTVKGLIGQLMSFMKPIVRIVIVGSLILSCSNNQGELVDKSPSSEAPTSAQAAAQDLPADHPPIGGSGMNSMTGGGMTALSPGPAPEAIVAGNVAKAAFLQFKIDPSWISEKPQSSMRAAQFRLPAPEGADGDGELAIFQGIGGSATANIQRWINQLNDRVGDPQIVKKQVGAFAIQTLDVTGTLAVTAMMGGAGESKTGYRMLAAVVEGPEQGPWHFKLTGPSETLEHWKPAFEAMIDSLELTP
ncbi:MAG: hypothetical protein JXR73_20380 [Candidatus Omnitrophica bacterium]|nr:hypothetical protein [Candidatus Omnitrophota bacterium]